MRNIIFSICLFFTFINCSSQNIRIKDLSNDFEMNYTFANIWMDCVVSYPIYNRGLFVKIFKMKDSKATPEGYFEGSDDVLESLIISIVPDGDYYTNSKLFKIVGLYNPEILEIKETIYPNFIIKIESGFKNKRITNMFELEGNK